MAEAAIVLDTVYYDIKMILCFIRRVMLYRFAIIFRLTIRSLSNFYQRRLPLYAMPATIWPHI